MKDTIKLPPHSIEAELCVLGAILIDNDAILAVSDFLKPEYFYDDKNALVYEAMLGLFENRNPTKIKKASYFI